MAYVMLQRSLVGGGANAKDEINKMDVRAKRPIPIRGELESCSSGYAWVSGSGGEEETDA